MNPIIFSEVTISLSVATRASKCEYRSSERVASYIGCTPAGAGVLHPRAFSRPITHPPHTTVRTRRSRLPFFPLFFFFLFFCLSSPAATTENTQIPKAGGETSRSMDSSQGEKNNEKR